MNILLIEDNTSFSTILEILLGSEGYSVTTASDGLDGIKLMEKIDVDIIVTDIRMPGLNGHEVLEHIKQNTPDVPVIIMTAYGTIPDAVKAIQAGAYDYISKPFENDEFLRIIQKAENFRNMAKENAQLKQYVKDSIRPVIIGESQGLQNVMNLVDTVAVTDAPVLISGESGTGKELIARAVHSRSNRCSKQLIIVNCAAIPENLFESELFGHKRGSFTGAEKDTKGKIAEANGGTLFLDEIGELPLSVQAKLLRFLQESEIQPVGSVQPVKVNVRVVAATNRDLSAKILDGTFREDLFYRLNVFPIEIPSLKERASDIPMLIDTFILKYGNKSIRVADAVMEKLTNYNWPGNIRELENTIYRLCILATDDIINITNLPTNISADPLSCLNLNLPEDKLDLEELEKCLIIKVLNKFKGNKSKSAEYLCIPRHVFLYRLEKFDIK